MKVQLDNDPLRWGWSFMVEKNSKLIPVEQIIERTIDSRKKRKKVVFFFHSSWVVQGGIIAMYEIIKSGLRKLTNLSLHKKFMICTRARCQ